MTTQKERLDTEQSQLSPFGQELPPLCLWRFTKTPVGVIGFAPYGKYLLGAGVHVRKEYRERGLVPILVEEMLRNKGGKKILVNIANKKIADTYRRAGFKDMEIGTLPQKLGKEQLLEEMLGLNKWRSLCSMSPDGLKF